MKNSDLDDSKGPKGPKGPKKIKIIERIEKQLQKTLIEKDCQFGNPFLLKAVN